MSNRAYYEYESALIKAVMAGEPEVVRGALAGAIKWTDDANITRILHGLLLANALPGTEFHKTLRALKENSEAA